ncbi:interleukin 17 receptor A1a [Cyprinodon tularosa]|uniref:interleukin 17 receptor A1a n=1 Tax=Cyprinodon tularosa TaxID=77115 RepID=UPI0018E1EAC6|nr:interleukin 17 receptor A1a [Cyprinodon tularosa]
MSSFPALLLLLGAAGCAAVGILSEGALTCSRQDVNCTTKYSNCMDPGWLVSHRYTPSEPADLQVSIDTRLDDAGHLQPVLQANWTLKDDGSISFLKATELHLLVKSTNQQMCLRYSLKDKLEMRSPSGEKWSFSSAALVLNPGEQYAVSVYNIPKPEQGHSSIDVSRDIRVPDCGQSKMKMTQFCIEGGSLWEPNISFDGTAHGSLAVRFSPHVLSKEYLVIMKCGSITENLSVKTDKQGSVNVKFSLDKWPRSCCLFDAEIKPYFLKCGNDCTRHKTSHSVCQANTTQTRSLTSWYGAVGGVAMFIIVAVIMCILCRKHGKRPNIESKEEGGVLRVQLKQAPKVMVIYSHDHSLYKDVVLKLCAFLQDKCGTQVVVDLLDNSSVSMLGRLRWLEWQRQQLDPSDKILVLCSPGVQAKWKAMCGHGRVTLKQDLLSPTDDMLTPFLNLFLPDLHQAGMLGKYMVAYFEDICSERDVPSVFDIGIKYILMKHFEELYFRILDIERYQPGHVNHIEGIGVDEYFNCASGKALRDAIETFHAYQIEDPNWFAKEVVGDVEEVLSETNQLLPPLQTPPVLECIPPIRDQLPVYVHSVDTKEEINSVHILTPHLNPEHQLSSVAELVPDVSSDCRPLYQPSQVEVLIADPQRSTAESLYIAQPVLGKQPLLQQNLVSLREPSSLQNCTEDDERGSSPSLDDFPVQRRPVEMEEELLEPTAPRSSSGSDQGYISKMSSQPEAPVQEDPLKSLVRLQEALFHSDYSSVCPEST